MHLPRGVLFASLCPGRVLPLLSREVLQPGGGLLPGRPVLCDCEALWGMPGARRHLPVPRGVLLFPVQQRILPVQGGGTVRDPL